RHAELCGPAEEQRHGAAALHRWQERSHHQGVGPGLLKRRADATQVTGAMRLLVVEDDPDLNRQLVSALTGAGYAVDAASDGEEGYFLGDTEPYDVVLLDLGLPKMDGISILEQWRRAGKKYPVIILTARDRWGDKVAGMDAGADDYLAKPFHMEELLARVRAQIRRSAGHATPELECGLLRLDTKSTRVSYDGQPIKLTSHEYRLL